MTVNERASERAIDSAKERARARGDFRVKNDTRDSLRALSPLEIPGFLGDATDETDNYRFGTGLRGAARKTSKEREMLSFKPLVQFRFATLTIFPLASSFPPSALSLLQPRMEAARARRDPGGRVSKSHLARESLPSLFPGSLSRGSLFHCRRDRRLLTFLSSRSTAAESRFFDLRVI